MREIVIIGGGAAGMLASLYASGPGNRVHVFEKNDRLGRKLFITGKGRCNLTNDCGQDQFLASVISNGKFLYSAFAGFSSQDVMALFQSLGVRTKVERGNRVFPRSDHSSDIIRALERRMKELQVRVHLKSTVTGLKVLEGKAVGVTLENGAEIPADAVLVATGGLSYPVTGSTGDGFYFAKQEGLKVTELSPSLVPMVTAERYITDMQGLSLRNVELRFRQQGKVIFREFGEMLFTHFGISGPLVLTASAKVGKNLTKGPLQGEIDLKPALDAEQLDRRILRDFEENKNRQFKNILGGLLPSKLTAPVLSLTSISGDMPVHRIEKKDRLAFGRLLKAFPFTVTGLRGYDEAIITRGGVSVREVDPRTMEAKKVRGLYFAGEILDVDALTGGFNLQIAWSTAHAAGVHMGKRDGESEEIMSFNIAIDGPAGAGKSTIAKKIAKKLSYIYVDTGAMYRAMALYFLRQGLDAEDSEGMAAVCGSADISIRYVDGEQNVLLNGENVTPYIRTEEVGNMASKSSPIPQVREKLTQLQKELAAREDVVMDGRDIGTCVLPGAQVKIYLTASTHTRALRRFKELEEKGVTESLEEIEADIADRDYRDMHRDISPLKQAEDAWYLDTSDMDIDEVVEAILDRVAQHREK